MTKIFQQNQLRTIKPSHSKNTQPHTLFKNHHYSISQEKGFSYEDIAIEYLQSQGLQLLHKNLACPLGEIDAVMRDKQTLVFIEVRFRQHNRYGGAIQSITPHKIKRLIRTAEYFLPFLSYTYFQQKTPFCRFDAVCIENNEKIWLKNITF
ncbi:YraN family protein [Pelistega ratti]|uniref:YraN family protein n=1 Tax=Pelistega ratti TaxID=2652177 RepID=UPI001358F1C8|nr:YraN family protein [Pelistega ratti]